MVPVSPPSEVVKLLEHLEEALGRVVGPEPTRGPRRRAGAAGRRRRARLSIASAKTSSASSPLPSPSPDVPTEPRRDALRILAGHDRRAAVESLEEADREGLVDGRVDDHPSRAEQGVLGRTVDVAEDGDVRGESGGVPRAGPREVRAAEHHELDAGEAPGELDEDPRTLDRVQPSEEGDSWRARPGGRRERVGRGWGGSGCRAGLDVVRSISCSALRGAGAGDAKAMEAAGGLRASDVRSQRATVESIDALRRFETRGELERGDTLEIGRRPRVANPDDRREVRASRTGR